jgi:hypothetical protein
MFDPEDLTSFMADRPLAVRVLAALWVVLTVVDATIWLLIGVIGGHLGQPWWLLVSVPLGVVALAAWWLTAPRPTDRGGDRRRADEVL